MKNFEANGEVLELESPFINLTTFKQRKPTDSELMENHVSLSSPFRSLYELEGMPQTMDAESTELTEIIDELQDEEFDEFLEELAFEAREVYENQFAGFQQNEASASRVIEEHFAPVLNEVDKFMDHMIEIAQNKEAQDFSDAEWDHLVDQYIVQMETSPEIEYWGLGSLKKLAKKAVKKVASKAKRAVKKYAKKGLKWIKEKGLAYAMRKVKQYAKPILKRALKWGINKLPRKYRPIANLLAKKLGILKEIGENEWYDQELDFQHELDTMLGEMLLTSNETELEILEGEFFNEEEAGLDNSLVELDKARENFIRQIGELEEGKSSEPAIEQFAPAVIYAIKLGIKFYGRDKLIGKISSPLAGYIAKYIGRNNAKILSGLLVDAGLRMFNLEHAPEDEVSVGSRAIASVVEETIRQVAQLPNHVVENQTLLEGHLLEAFETAAKRNLPDVLKEEWYIKRPDLRESSKHKVAWTMKPMGKGKNMLFRYKKLNMELEAELNPYTLNEVKTFGGIPLGNVLRDQLGVQVNRSVPVKVHLFETLPGGYRYHIAKNETVISRNGSVDTGQLLPQIHPLTSVAAGLLLSQPALGCPTTSKCLANKSSHVPHRYYYLEIPGARPLMHVGSSGLPSLRKVSGLKLKMDFLKSQIKMFLYLSEHDAQGIASLLRQKDFAKASQHWRSSLSSGLKTAFSKHSRNHIRLVHPKIIPGANSGKSLDYIPANIQKILKDKLQDWLSPKLSDYFQNKGDEFTAATDVNADGVTVCITLAAPSDFAVLGQFLMKQKVQLPEQLFKEAALASVIETKSGYYDV